ncbi:MAG: tRNA (adenosine(37)-N6)-threonylcarbamoyltransferase complex ATPase subunit type 1 TsaE [Desulfoarculaceae bacterium]|nr:tRNA (adenosine(37)-N6)-threonylcarbamoyltransferase complex ATPase subunit type 1 TsaE [Desulfoarculaceae bacterium]
MTIMKTMLLKTLADTMALGRLLGQCAQPGDVICLDGDLGAGKTTLTQAIAQGLGVPAGDYVTSPSFAILHEYQGRLPLYHMDFYRLTGAADIQDMGLDEYFFLSGLSVLEWSARAGDLVPATRLKINLTIGPDDSRLLTCDPGIGTWQERWQNLIMTT